MEETRNESPYSNGKDRISSLPDEIIHCILSFNDTRKVVQTCVLSKTWIHTWKSVPFLSINRSSFPLGKEHDQMFIRYVDMVFILRNESDIQRFVIHWCRYDEGEDIVMKNVYRWIVQAVKRNVEEMRLEIRQGPHPESFEIPHQLVNCKSLVNLGMQVDFGVRCTNVILPKSMDLPRLKVLWIHGVSITNEELSKRLFSSCPVLENLFLYYCDIPNLTVNSLSLKNFVYKQFHNGTANVIKLTTPNLNDFKCVSSVTQHYSLESCSLLSNVTFDLALRERVFGENAEAYSQEEQVYAKRMMNFLIGAYMVKYMALSSGFLEVLSREPDLLDSQPPRLYNLQCLLLKMRSTRGCLRAIAYLLKISPHMEDIFLQSKQSNLVDVGDDWEAGLSSKGMLSRLAFVNFDELEGCDAEIKLLRFLLIHAKVLRKVGLSFRASTGSPDGERQMKLFGEKVRALPTASSSVLINFRVGDELV